MPATSSSPRAPLVSGARPRSDADAGLYSTRTVFPEVAPRPKDLMREVQHVQIRVGICVDEHQRVLGNSTSEISYGGSSCRSSTSPSG